MIFFFAKKNASPHARSASDEASFLKGASPVWIPHFLVQKCPYTSMFK